MKLMNEHELAAMLGVSVHTVRNWRRGASGPPIRRVGGLIRYDSSEVEEWTRAGKVPVEEPLLVLETKMASDGGAVSFAMVDYGAPGVEARGTLASMAMATDDFLAWFDETVTPIATAVRKELADACKQ
jgi:hypothetical protein